MDKKDKQFQKVETLTWAAFNDFHDRAVEADHQRTNFLIQISSLSLAFFGIIFALNKELFQIKIYFVLALILLSLLIIISIIIIRWKLDKDINYNHDLSLKYGKDYISLLDRDLSSLEIGSKTEIKKEINKDYLGEVQVFLLLNSFLFFTLSLVGSECYPQINIIVIIITIPVLLWISFSNKLPYKIMKLFEVIGNLITKIVDD